MPRPDQLCECAHERQEHGRGPCTAVVACERCDGAGVVSRLVRHPGGWDIDADDQPCPECQGRRVEACTCRGFKAALMAESPRTLELSREDVVEIRLAMRAMAMGWVAATAEAAGDGVELTREVRANYRRIAGVVDEQLVAQDREEGFCEHGGELEGVQRCRVGACGARGEVG